MAYRRSITARSILFYQHRLSPSISHSQYRHQNVSENSETSPISRNPHYIQHRFLGAGNNFSNYRRFAVPAGCGMGCTRNYSSEADRVDFVTEVVGVLGIKAPMPAVSPELVSIIDSFPTVAPFQHLIDYVHCFTGFNWWASIAATTIMIRFLMLPIDIYHMKTEAKHCSQDIPEPNWNAIEKEFKVSVDGYRGKNWNALIKENTGPEPIIGPIISASVQYSMFLAVISMAAKDPSFKEGGALWFTNLTDGRDILLLMLTLTIYLRTMRIPGIKSNEVMGSKWSLGLLKLPIVGELCPKAVHFVWTTSVLFTLMYELAIKNPQVKKLLGIPSVSVELPSTNQKSNEGRKEKKS